ncbi:MAG: type II secretion system F family protein [Phycisphaerales bacterium]
MKFEYRAYDNVGNEAKGVIDASEHDDAVERLRRKGLFVVGVTPASGGEPAERGKRQRTSGGGAKRKQLAMMARELSVLVTTGTPVVDALAAVERQSDDQKWKGVLHDVRERIEGGSTFADALETRPDVFDAVFRSLIAAGESSGRLDEMLMRLATLTRRQMAARSHVVGALIYPALLLTVCAVVLTVMISVVLPRFEGLFETLNAPLPASTKMLMAFSDFVRSYWWAIVPGMIVGVIGLALYVRTSSGKRALDSVMIRMPQFGRVTRSLCVARILRLLGTLLDSRVPMMEALALTRDSVGNRHYAAVMEHAEEAVTRGESVSDAFSRSGLIPASTCEAIRNGEQSGKLAVVLSSLADYMDEENQTTLKSLGTLLEPIIMIALGLVVGFVAVSMFLPLFDLTASAGKAG